MTEEEDVAVGPQTTNDRGAGRGVNALTMTADWDFGVIADANVGAEHTNATLSQIQTQLQLAVLAQRNAQSAGVLTLFNGR